MIAFANSEKQKLTATFQILEDGSRVREMIHKSEEGEENDTKVVRAISLRLKLLWLILIGKRVDISGFQSLYCFSCDGIICFRRPSLAATEYNNSAYVWVFRN